MKVITHTKQNRTLLPAILLLILAFTLYITMIVLMRSKQADIAAVSQELALQYERERHAKDTARFLADIRTRQKEIDSYFVAPDVAVTQIEQIEQLGRSAGISLEILEVNTERTENGDSLLSIDLHAEGQWQNIVHLLSLLEDMPVQLIIPTVSITSHTNETGAEIQWDMNATIHIGLQNI